MSLTEILKMFYLSTIAFFSIHIVQMAEVAVAVTEDELQDRMEQSLQLIDSKNYEYREKYGVSGKRKFQSVSSAESSLPVKVITTLCTSLAYGYFTDRIMRYDRQLSPLLLRDVV